MSEERYQTLQASVLGLSQACTI